MRKRVLMIFALNLSVYLVNASEGVLSGNGTDENPFLLEDYLDLVAIADSGLDKVYRLANNIDASASDTANAGAGFIPIGDYYTIFTGKIHGGGHVIRNLKIYQPAGEDIGFIGNLYGSEAVIDSLGMVDCNITGGDWVGGICANQEQSSLITDCYVTGKVSGNMDIGGITGYQEAGSITIRNCHSHCNVSGGLEIGGLVGFAMSVTIDNCYTTGTITGSTITGGLAGSIQDAVVNNCYSTSTVAGVDKSGGLIGQISDSTITNCFYTGKVSGQQQVGGIAGYNDGTIVTNCYVTGSVKGNSMVGGLLGNMNTLAVITYCYVSGPVIADTMFGGLTGRNDLDSVRACYWNTEITGCSQGIGSGNNPSAYGLTTEQMKDSAFIDSLDYSSVWKIRTDSTYPGLQTISNNAPFAFCDLLEVASRISVNWLLNNDYDIETLQENLVIEIDTIHGIGAVDIRNRFTFPPLTPIGTKDTIIYRIGEALAAGDTLWGNTTYALLEKIENTAPVAVNLHFTINKNDTLKALIPDLLDGVINPDHDLLWLSSIYSPSHGGCGLHSDTVFYFPEEGWIGKDSLRYKISDGELSDSAYLIINVIEPVSSVGNDYTGNETVICPNPASEGFYIDAGEIQMTLAIYDTRGYLVSSRKIEGKSYVDIGNLPDGVYFVSVNGNIYKFIKKE